MILQEIADHFEAVATQMDRGMQAFADDHSPPLDLAALHRCRDAAKRGAMIARNAISEVNRIPK